MASSLKDKSDENFWQFHHVPPKHGECGTLLVWLQRPCPSTLSMFPKPCFQVRMMP